LRYYPYALDENRVLGRPLFRPIFRTHVGTHG
jgi:hypothetical protein